MTLHTTNAAATLTSGLTLWGKAHRGRLQAASRRIEKPRVKQMVRCYRLINNAGGLKGYRCRLHTLMGLLGRSSSPAGLHG